MRKNIVLPKDFTVTAHTGCMKTEENSLESFKAGIENGANIVEFDLYFTKKGEQTMIIIIGLPVIVVGLIIWALLTAVCAAIFGIQNSWADDRVEWLKVYTVKQKWGLFAVLLAWMASVAAVVSRR